MLTDEEYNLMMSIPDATEREDIDGNDLRYVATDMFQGDLTGPDTWKHAWNQADRLNEEHNEDHISFVAVKHCQNYYVLDKKDARKLKIIA